MRRLPITLDCPRSHDMLWSCTTTLSRWLIISKSRLYAQLPNLSRPRDSTANFTHSKDLIRTSPSLAVFSTNLGTRAPGAAPPPACTSTLDYRRRSRRHGMCVPPRDLHGVRAARAERRSATDRSVCVGTYTMSKGHGVLFSIWSNAHKENCLDSLRGLSS